MNLIVFKEKYLKKVILSKVFKVLFYKHKDFLSAIQPI